MEFSALLADPARKSRHSAMEGIQYSQSGVAADRWSGSTGCGHAGQFSSPGLWVIDTVGLGKHASVLGSMADAENHLWVLGNDYVPAHTYKKRL